MPAALRPFGDSCRALLYWSPLADRVLEHADARDLELHAIARLEPARRLAKRAHARRRPGRDHVAGLERHVTRDVFDEERDGKGHVARAAILHQIVVDP